MYEKPENYLLTLHGMEIHSVNIITGQMVLLGHLKDKYEQYLKTRVGNIKSWQITGGPDKGQISYGLNLEIHVNTGSSEQEMQSPSS